MNPGPGPWSSTMLYSGPSDPLENLCHHSDSKHDMDSLPIPNADDSVLSEYPNITRLLVQISSSAAKRTAMVERISMFLQILSESSELETVANSMLRTSIQISFLHSEILLAVGTMQRRMATFVAGNYEDQNLLEVLKEADKTMDGTDSELQSLGTSFSELRASISLVTWSNPSTASVHTQTGSLEWIDRLMCTIQNSRSVIHNWMAFGNGLGSFLPVANMVCIAPCTLGCSQSHSPPLRGGDFHDAEARRSPSVAGLAWRRQEEWAFTNWI
ncbi:Rep [Murine feces-associated gemycircularvirus 1]|nr:Rep [Murine feces-associated gemycircularvirus 1]